MAGNAASNTGELLFLLDESLTPAVAEALNLVGYNFSTAEAEFGRQGAPDPEIIAWCRDHEAVWVHADDRARRQHRALLQTSSIRTILIHRSGGRMTGREQLRILSFVVPKFLENIEQRPGTRHYRATAANPTSTPTLRPMTI